jgi:hypothetical protein
MNNQPTDDGGPVFPQSQRMWDNDAGSWAVHSTGGMSLRDWFAGMALQGLVSSAGAGIFTAEEAPRYEIASYSYKYADTMLAARKGEQPQ